MKQICYFAADGTLLNIGPWDLQEAQEVAIPAVIDEETGAELEPAVYETVTRNPIPEGAYTEEREVVVSPGGGLYLADSPQPKSVQQELAEMKQLLADLASLQLEV